MECQRKYKDCKGTAEVKLKSGRYVCRNCLEWREAGDIVEEL